ncbi:OmpA family protein [Aestuariibius sp. HNIBRBA575]|uniref:OmpA family protein n=1 Tax=Aestuariibius sp. HNIBRBA575 TaxID=3233343 RepID=UPI0034A392D8
MRRLVGGAGFAIGLGVLGWFSATFTAPDIQQNLTRSAAFVADQSQHGVQIDVHGRDIIVRGLVNDPTEAQALLQRFDRIAGRRVVVMQTTPIPVAAPFEITITDQDALGAVPSEQARAQLRSRIGDLADGLILSSGVPNDWNSAVKVGMDARDLLNEGEMILRDQNLILTGLASDPDAKEFVLAMLQQLPDGYHSDARIELLDDGTPMRIDLQWDGTDAQADGKIPVDFLSEPLALDTFSAQTFGDAGALNGTLEQAHILGPVDWNLAAQHSLQALGHLSSGRLQIEGMQIRITGQARPAQREEALALLTNLPDTFGLYHDIALWDDGAPFELHVDITGMSATAAGKIPADVTSQWVADTLGADQIGGDVQVAFINDETGLFVPMADIGLRALGLLVEGALDVSGQGIDLTGLAEVPADREQVLAMLETVAEGQLRADIAVLDDGAPADFVVTYAAQNGAIVSGKLPRGLTPADIAQAWGVHQIAGEPLLGLVGQESDAIGLFALGDMLPEIETLRYHSTADGLRAEIALTPGIDAELVQSAIRSLFETDSDRPVSVVFQDGDVSIPTGTRRVNAATGIEEAFIAGVWLPVLTFSPSLQACQAWTDGALADGVNFVTASTRLDAKSMRSLNLVASIAQNCVFEGGLLLEVGGHTDDTGNDQVNNALSLERAGIVRQVLVTRGVAGSVITAHGYGSQVPIVSNETSEGRAQNRRTTMTWIDPAAGGSE